MKDNPTTSSEVSKITEFIHQKKLEAPAIFLLESLYPCRGLMHHCVDFFDPVGKLICPAWTTTLQEILANQESYERLIKSCENQNSEN